MRGIMRKCLCLILAGIMVLSGCSKKDGGAAESGNGAAGGGDGAPVAADVTGETFGETTESAQNTKSQVIAVSLPASESGWNMQMAQAAEEYLKALVSDTFGYELLTSTDAAGQAAQLDALAAEGVSAVVICPIDGSAIAESALKLQNSGVPVVLFNGSIEGLLPAATVTLTEDFLGAKAAAKVKTKGNAVESILMFTNDSSYIASVRTQSFESGLSSGIALVNGGNTSGDMQTAQDLMANWLSDKKDEELKKIGGIYAPDENSLLGIMNGLAAYEKKNGTAFPNLKIVAGCGGSNDLFAFMKEHTEYPMVVFYYPPYAVTTAISLAKDIADGKSYEDAVSVEAVEVNSDNAVDYMDEK